MRVGRAVYRAAMAAALLLCGVEAMQKVRPEQVGLDSGKLDQIMERLQNQVDTGQLPGAALVIYRGGKIAYERTVGYSDIGFGQAMRTDTLVRLLSMSKPVAAVAVMKLVEQGRISLEDPVAKWHQGFYNMRVDVGNGQTVPANRLITIRDLLMHTAGMGYSAGFNAAEGSASVFSSAMTAFQTLDEFMDDQAATPLIAQPGARWSYSWSYDVLGYVIQKVTGQSPDAYIAAEVTGPLGMDDTGFYVPWSKIGRFAVAYTMGPNGVLVPVIRPRIDPIQSYSAPNFISCGSGLISTADDYARFAQMLVNGGELDGVRILKPETVDMMWRNSLPNELLPLDLNGWISDANTGWGLSGTTVSTAVPIKSINWNSKTGSQRTGSISWGGASMANWVASADTDMVVVFTTQRLATPIPNTFIDVVMAGIWGAITGGSGRALPGAAPAAPAQTGKQTGKQTVVVAPGGSWKAAEVNAAAEEEEEEEGTEDVWALPRDQSQMANSLLGALIEQGLPNTVSPEQKEQLKRLMSQGVQVIQQEAAAREQAEQEEQKIIQSRQANRALRGN